MEKNKIWEIPPAIVELIGEKKRRRLNSLMNAFLRSFWHDYRKGKKSTARKGLENYDNEELGQLFIERSLHVEEDREIYEGLMKHFWDDEKLFETYALLGRVLKDRFPYYYTKWSLNLEGQPLSVTEAQRLEAWGEEDLPDRKITSQQTTHLNSLTEGEIYSRDVSDGKQKERSTRVLTFRDSWRGCEMHVVKDNPGGCSLHMSRVVVNVGGTLYVITSEGLQVMEGKPTGRGVSVFQQYFEEETGDCYELQHQFHKGAMLQSVEVFDNTDDRYRSDDIWRD